jgi:dynein light chain 4, axonemal
MALPASGQINLTEAEYRKLTQKALTRSVDMSIEMQQETMEIVVMSVDKFQATKNYEASAQLIKSTMDKKFGSSWHVAIGEGFGFDITYQSRNMIYVYYGSIGVLCYKC